MAYSSSFALVPVDRSDPAPSIGGGGSGGGSDLTELSDYTAALAAGAVYGTTTSVTTAGAVAAGDLLWESPTGSPGLAVENFNGGPFFGVATASAASGATVTAAIGPNTYVPIGFQAAPVEIRLTNATSGTTTTKTSVDFRDSGGLPLNYQANESYNLVFDAGSGNTWEMTPQSFEFEHSSGGSMYDRLGIQTSTNGSTWANVALTGFLTSSTSTAPWSTSQNPGGAPGWIFPQTSVGSPVTGVVVPLAARYVRFTFFSDGSAQRAGWDISMVSTGGGGGTIAVAYDTALYISATAPEKVDTTPNGTVLAYSRSDAVSGQIYARLAAS